MAENKGPHEGEELKKPDEGGHVIDAHKTVTAERALKLLKGGVEAGAARQAERREIAGQKGIEPLRAYNNLQEALKLVREYFGQTLKINLDDIQFRKFHGNMVGESTKEGTYIDPIMLMHPAVRLAHVISHELAHKNKKITNEALVEGYVHLWFGHDNAEHGYQEAVEKFKQFAKKFGGKKDMRKVVSRIYELYYAGRYKDIYKEFEANHIRGLKSEKEKDKAFELFREVFPELHYVESGEFEMKHLQEHDEKGGSVGAGGKAGKVRDLEAYRNRVDETERGIIKTGTNE